MTHYAVQYVRLCDFRCKPRHAPVLFSVLSVINKSASNEQNEGTGSETIQAFLFSKRCLIDDVKDLASLDEERRLTEKLQKCKSDQRKIDESMNCCYVEGSSMVQGASEGNSTVFAVERMLCRDICYTAELWRVQHPHYYCGVKN